MKKSSLLLIGFFLVSGLVLRGTVFPDKIEAQGTFTCNWNGSSCVVGSNNCTFNPPNCYEPIPGFCPAFNSSMCDTMSDSCIDTDCSTVTPPSSGGTATSGCDNCSEGICTAIGCIDVSSAEGFVSSLLKLAVGIGGGIAFLLIIFGVFQILTSTGNPEKIQAGQQLITSAIAGLLLIIFSLFLLELIGVKILKIPGFGLP